VDHTVASDFLEHARFVLGTEYRTKLRAAVEALPPDKLWWRPNDQSNSVGNLLLHLAGNIRQWAVVGIPGATDTRNRAAEFAAHDGENAHALLAQMDATLDETDRVLAAMSADELLTHRTIQGRDVTVYAAITQVIEHFALHLGQIILIAKWLQPGSVKFYEEAGGFARPVWMEKAATKTRNHEKDI